MLKVKLEKPKRPEYKMVMYKHLEIGQVFQASDSNEIFDKNSISIKTSNGRFKIEKLEYLDDDIEDDREMSEMVYLLEAELNVKKILN